MWHSHDDQLHKQLYWDTVSGDAFRLWYGLVGECLALRKWDGILPRYVALCATPGLAARFEELFAELLTIDGLIEDRGSEIELLLIEGHIPPPRQRPEVMAPRKRANLEDHWQRKCDRGDHNSHCPPATCPTKLAKAQARKRRQPVADPVSTTDGRGATVRQPVPLGRERDGQGQALEVRGYAVGEAVDPWDLPEPEPSPPGDVDLLTGEIDECSECTEPLSWCKCPSVFRGNDPS